MKLIAIFLLITLSSFVNADFDDAYGHLKQKEYTKAFTELKPLAEQGHVPSQMNLGWMHHKGLGVEQNYKTAIKWYEMAANQDNEDAQHTLGNLYRNGEGKKDAVTKDLNKAMYYYKKASDNGFPYSTFTIGVMYEKGEGVNKSIKNATKWFKKTYEHDSVKKKILGLWDSFRITFLLDNYKDVHYKYRLLAHKSLELTRVEL
jgi:tetratricopeptide (TPR) repeat protein